MFFEVNAGFDDKNAFGFEKLLLHGSVRFANKEFAAGAEDAVPGNAFSLRNGSHGAARSACPACEAQNSGNRSIGKTRRWGIGFTSSDGSQKTRKKTSLLE